jgi:phenylacetic acid degradation protein
MPPPRVYAIDGVIPVVDPAAFVHPSAVLIGDVIVGPGCFVGPCAVLRGDFGRVVVKRGSNLQDTCVVHGFPDRDTVVEENAHVGHGAVLHCCTIDRNVLVGMNAVVMDGAMVGESSFVAACSFVKAGTLVPPRSLVAGVPAKVVRPLSERELRWKLDATAAYQELTRRSLANMVEAEALPAMEPGRRRIPGPDVRPLHETGSDR